MSVAGTAEAGVGSRRRANTELSLLLLALLVILCAYALVGLAQSGVLPAGLLAYGGAMAALAAAAHLTSRRLAAGADPVLLPLAFLLNGLGLVMVRRLDFAEETAQAPAQTVWTVLAVAVFVVVLVVVRDYRVLDRYRYLIGIGALVFLLMPSVPALAPRSTAPRSGSGSARCRSSQARSPSSGSSRSSRATWPRSVHC